MKEIGKIKNPYDGYVEILYQTAKRYYRIVRTAVGNLYNIYANDSRYGFKSEDYGTGECEYTIKECKAAIKKYEEER